MPKLALIAGKTIDGRQYIDESEARSVLYYKLITAHKYPSIPDVYVDTRRINETHNSTRT